MRKQHKLSTHQAKLQAKKRKDFLFYMKVGYNKKGKRLVNDFTFYPEI